ncbi:MAG: shikimate kinase [Desulfobulbaceae bacterium]|nr:shikimate kinase [Desulfobulbaceae bacterium]
MLQLPLKIILTGYRACGKSLVGRLLAERLGIDFLDMDKEIEAREGCTISAMVAAHGWPYFRERERGLLAELVGRDRLVVATGGGAIMHAEVWQQLKETGLVVWLRADTATIAARLNADEATNGQRPSLTGDSITREIAAVLAERIPMYQKGSHLTVDTSYRSPEEIVEQIATAWAMHGS